MKHLLTISLLITLCFGAAVIRAPKVKAVEVNETSELVNMPKIQSPTSLDQHIISSIPDLRSTAGSSGKNIVFAEDGQSIAIIYSRYSGDPTNIMRVYVAYSTDRGNTWIHPGPLSTFNARRTYSALDAEENFPTTGLVHFVWHQAAQIAGSYDSSPCYYAKELSFPSGLITVPVRLPNSGARDVWMPCIGVRDSFTVITAANIGTFITNYNVYIWRCVSGVWDTGRVFIEGHDVSGPHFRFGNNGYMFFLWLQVDNPNLYWPYYCESFDYGETWTDPQIIWGNTPPYPDMSNVTGWWYQFDCEVVKDTPVVTLKFGTGNYDYGEIWVYRPDSGVAGNWRFRGKKLVGGDSTAPQTFARYPTVAADDEGNTFIGYQAFFIIPGDTVFDCGLFARPAGQDTWYNWGRCTFNGDIIEENHLEFAHNAALIANGDSSIIGMIYHNAGTYPTTGNLYFDYFIVPNPPIPPAVTIDEPIVSKLLEISVIPNPFCNSVKFVFPFYTGKAKLSIFDVSGKLIRELTTNNKPPKTEFVWDSRKNDGSLANPGVYFYNLSSGDYQQQGKLILTR